MPDLLFDTHALITLFERQPGWEIVRDHMRVVDDNGCSGFIPTVVLTEIMYLYIQQEGSLFEHPATGNRWNAVYPGLQC